MVSDDLKVKLEEMFVAEKYVQSVIDKKWMIEEKIAIFDEIKEAMNDYLKDVLRCGGFNKVPRGKESYDGVTFFNVLVGKNAIISELKAFYD